MSTAGTCRSAAVRGGPESASAIGRRGRAEPRRGRDPGAARAELRACGEGSPPPGGIRERSEGSVRRGAFAGERSGGRSGVSWGGAGRRGGRASRRRPAPAGPDGDRPGAKSVEGGRDSGSAPGEADSEIEARSGAVATGGAGVAARRTESPPGFGEADRFPLEGRGPREAVVQPAREAGPSVGPVRRSRSRSVGRAGGRSVGWSVGRAGGRAGGALPGGGTRGNRGR